MEVRDLLDKTSFEVEFVRSLHAGGRDGETHIVRLPGDESTYVEKRYHAGNTTDEVTSHLVQITRYVHVWLNPSVRRCLPGLPVRCYSYPDGTISSLSRYVDGSDLSHVEVYQRLSEEGLAAQLEVARSLAFAGYLLESGGIITADYSDANTICDLKTRTAAPVDLDASGVYAARAGRTIRIPPRARYKPNEGLILSPAMVLDESVPASFISDRWALAVMFHRILRGGKDPLVVRMSGGRVTAERAIPQEIATGGAVWAASPQAGSHPALATYRAFIRSLGPRLEILFSMAFARGKGLLTGSSAPRAGDWLKALDDAIDDATTCSTCGKEFVAPNDAICPYCTRF